MTRNISNCALRSLRRRWRALIRHAANIARIGFCWFLILAGCLCILWQYQKVVKASRLPYFHEYHQVKPYSEIIDANLPLPEFREGTPAQPQFTGEKEL
jgi:TRAP-type C4-dicarboxylate transport system permease small subunit